jgi:hypothetical protein
MRAAIRYVGGNAMLGTPDANGWCICWHREDMTIGDRMHIDDWRARIIAGS